MSLSTNQKLIEYLIQSIRFLRFCFVFILFSKEIFDDTFGDSWWLKEIGYVLICV